MWSLVIGTLVLVALAAVLFWTIGKQERQPRIDHRVCRLSWREIKRL